MYTETTVWIRQHIPYEAGKSKGNKELRDKLKSWDIMLDNNLQGGWVVRGDF